MNDKNPYEPPDELSWERRDRNTAIIGLVSAVAVIVFVVLLAMAGAASYLLLQSDDPGLTSPVVAEPVEEPTIAPADKKVAQ